MLGVLDTSGPGGELLYFPILFHFFVSNVDTGIPILLSGGCFPLCFIVF
jgi:hypothetical protein